MELSMQMRYDQMARAVGQRLNVDPYLIQFFKCQKLVFWYINVRAQMFGILQFYVEAACLSSSCNNYSLTTTSLQNKIVPW